MNSLVMSPPCLTWQSEEVDRVESQVMHLRSQVVAELEAKLAKNHQKLAQFTTDMQIEVQPLHLSIPVGTAALVLKVPCATVR